MCPLRQNQMVACSNRLHTIINFHNDVDNVIMQFDADRPYTAGCSGGVTGMALSHIQARGKLTIEPIASYQSGSLGSVEERIVTQLPTINLPTPSCDSPVLSSMRTHAINPKTVDLKHLVRRCSRRGIAFPCTRDIRNFIHHHGAAVLYLDIDSHLNKPFETSLSGMIDLPACRWKHSDYSQSGDDDMNRLSLFKQADHAVVLAGWSCEHKYWRIANSWGTGWGHKGMLLVYDENVCASDLVPSAHSNGAGPACSFGSSISAFSLG